jgi:anaerobic ribonucleoside-triphosphate reductase activating protein
MADVPDDLTLPVAQVVPCTEAEGPGKRFAVWFQGCPLRCPGCCNPEFLPFTGGDRRSRRELVGWFEQTRSSDAIEGISLLGGEPFAHAAGAAALARSARERGLSVMVYSGYTLDEIRAMPDPAAGELLAVTDVLVDGPYVRDRPDHRRRWIGSTNQAVHFLTDRYRPDDRCWDLPNTLEIRVRDGVIELNGFPAPHAVGLWQPKWRRKGVRAETVPRQPDRVSR